MNRQGKVPEHGTLSRYHGTTGVPACRCTRCRQRAVREDARRTMERLAGNPRHVPAKEASQHAQALRSRGLNYAQISRASGQEATTVRAIALGLRKYIGRDTAAAILSVPLTWSSSVGLVSALGAARRIRALYAIGVPTSVITAEVGMSKDSTNLLVTGRWSALDARHDAAIRSAYDRLWQCPGSSLQNVRRAKREGWPGPLHWDDASIDDPDGFPDWTGDCGTVKGYKRHSRDASLPPPCEPCKRARASTERATDTALAA